MTQALAVPLAAPIPSPWPWRVPRKWAVRLLIGFVVFLVVGNLAIQGVSLVARQMIDTGRIPGVEGVDKLRAIDDRVWRGAHPSHGGFRSLAAAGVTVVVDLRAEDYATDDDAFIQSLGMQVVHVPIRDGQTPSGDEVALFLNAIGGADGPVFVHCGAGIGRTGAMVAAYLNATGGAGSGSTLSHNLAVGPPSFEQIVYAGTGGDEPNIVVKAISRTLDGPRRLWHNL